MPNPFAEQRPHSNPCNPQPKFTIINPHDFGSKAELARPGAEVRAGGQAPRPLSPKRERGELIPIFSPRPLGAGAWSSHPGVREDGTGGRREYQKPRVTQRTLCYPLKYRVGFGVDEED